MAIDSNAFQAPKTQSDPGSTFARKIGIIGAGNIGATIAYAAMIRGVALYRSRVDGA